jgi:hypothetical protein
MWSWTMTSAACGFLMQGVRMGGTPQYPPGLGFDAILEEEQEDDEQSQRRAGQQPSTDWRVAFAPNKQVSDKGPYMLCLI